MWNLEQREERIVTVTADGGSERQHDEQSLELRQGGRNHHHHADRVVLLSQSYDDGGESEHVSSSVGGENGDLAQALLSSSSRRGQRTGRGGMGLWARRSGGGSGSGGAAGAGPADGDGDGESSPPFSLFERWSGWVSQSLQQLLQRVNPGLNRGAARQLLRTLGDYLAYLTLLTMFVCFPMVLYRALANRNLDLAAWHSAGVVVCGTLILSLRQVYLHLTHWYMPEVQKYVVRILTMVPIYSIQSWLSLRFHETRLYMDSIRDLYEAFVIASFVYYLIELLGGQEALVQLLIQKRDAGSTLGQHRYPLKLILQPWELGAEFMLQCKHGVLQYVLFKTIATLLIYFFELTGTYREGTFSWTAAYPYMCFFQNISVMYALYSLVMLYSAVKEELEDPVDWRPLGKFLCIKGVIFFTWWQSVLIFYLRAHGVIGAVGDWSSRDVAYGLIDYCVVIEMVGFAIAHGFTFAYTEYLPGSVPTPEMVCRQRQEQEQPLQGSATGPYDDPSGGGATEEPRRANSNPPLPPPKASNSYYRPPATLEQPMKFRDALWSSSVPRETIQDIQRLRTGFDTALQEVLCRDNNTGISLPEMDIRSDLELTDDSILNDGGEQRGEEAGGATEEHDRVQSQQDDPPDGSFA